MPAYRIYRIYVVPGQSPTDACDTRFLLIGKVQAEGEETALARAKRLFPFMLSGTLCVTKEFIRVRRVSTSLSDRNSSPPDQSGTGSAGTHRLQTVHRKHPGGLSLATGLGEGKQSPDRSEEIAH
jgi:hypothetical protein